MKNSIKFKKNLFAFSIKIIFLSVIILFTQITPGFSQDETPPSVEVKMKDGSTLIGELILETDEKLVIKTRTMGEITILKSNIINYRRLRTTKQVDGVYWHENPNPTRNLYGPTGYNLRKGEGYYQNFMLFLNQVSYGFTDRFTIGVGVEIVSILGAFGEGFPGFTITPKYAFPIKEDKWNVGLGLLALHVPGNDELFSAGIVYGVSTWGSRDNNFTFGLGYGIVEGEFSKRPIVTLAGNIRVARRFGLVTENWFFSAGEEVAAFLSFGGRYIGERVSWDFALVAGSFDSELVFIPIPLVGVAFPFGKGWKD